MKPCSALQSPRSSFAIIRSQDRLHAGGSLLDIANRRNILDACTMGSCARDEQTSNSPKDFEDKEAPVPSDKEPTRKRNKEASCGCPCARPGAMVHAGDDWNPEDTPTLQCECRRCGPPDAHGRRRCTNVMLWPFAILSERICNNCSTGLSFIERLVERNKRKDYGNEGHEGPSSEDRRKVRRTT